MNYDSGIETSSHRYFVSGKIPYLKVLTTARLQGCVLQFRKQAGTFHSAHKNISVYCESLLRIHNLFLAVTISIKGLSSNSY